MTENIDVSLTGHDDCCCADNKPTDNEPLEGIVFEGHRRCLFSHYQSGKLGRTQQSCGKVSWWRHSTSSK